jgi:hypothetical protein
MNCTNSAEIILKNTLFIYDGNEKIMSPRRSPLLEDTGKWNEKLENYWTEDERCNCRIIVAVEQC